MHKNNTGRIQPSVIKEKETFAVYVINENTHRNNQQWNNNVDKTLQLIL